jgi:hypothetical protein
MGSAQISDAKSILPNCALNQTDREKKANVRYGSLADIQRHTQLRPLSGVKRT